ncbi:hypothetical protein [Rhodoferax sp.]|uniref:hypothetical protein n=1 Tax=Rhodoferax sp. TaxID=50421 RepID=UPI00284FB7F6|nr:hypothetical protein [Rhodoferax sp.]MDR3369059.1 hypothetical protein [Rhodoferax sp.]
MTTNTKPTNGDGLATPHDQPAISTPISTLILRAIHARIKRATSGFCIDRGIGLDAITLLILMVVFVIQGVLQWMH